MTLALEKDPLPPYEITGSEELGRAGDVVLRRDGVRWPDGTETWHRYVESPSAVWIVPVHEDLTTVLVRQWRHAWGETAWEVPAGTMEPGEEPQACGQRELVEEAGLMAADWTALGVTRGTALLTGRQHLFLARRLSRVQRMPDASERDLIVRELPFREALDAALRGDLEHAATVAALTRAARMLGVS